MIWALCSSSVLVTPLGDQPTTPRHPSEKMAVQQASPTGTIGIELAVTGFPAWQP